ncbi:MAG: cytochrome c4 [Gammaproteobacteria bacterium]|nr:cytochrome c4 [Gammaproteobacteria bacterium]
MTRFPLFTVFLLTLGVAHSVAASSMQPAPRTPSVSDVRSTLASMPHGDVQRGKKLNQSLMCASCHGDDGVAPTQNWASLAGQRAAYTYKSLLDYQTGGRHENDRATLMKVVVKGMSRQDMADVAAYYASLPAKAAPAPRLDAAAHARTDRLARRGDPARLLTPCASCHGVAGQGGVNETPALAGQSVGSFVRTMQDYREGRRVTDANQGMRQFAERLTMQEIHDLAAYYARPGKN